MGTRSTIHFQQNGTTLASIYQQYDGYPDSVGLELANFLDGITVVNGISLNESRRIANGVGCLAAQFVTDFKNGPGGLYLTVPDAREEYNYFVNCDCDGCEIQVSCDDQFSGTVSEFKKWCENPS